MNRRNIFILLAAAAVLSGCQSKPAAEPTPHELIKEGRTEEAKDKYILAYDVNALDEDGNTVLHLAAKMNDADLVTYFIIKGADTELKNYAGDTALHVAINNDAYDAAKLLSAVGGNLFSRNSGNITALDLGLARDPVYYDIFITTKSGEIRDVEGRSIVHYFVQTGNLTGIEYCIKKGIPISVKDNYGKTPLDLAFDDIDNEKSVQIAAALISGGADPVETKLQYFQDAVAARNLNYRFADGQTPLHLSIIYGYNAVAKYLLENGASTAAQDSSGSTPLHEAVRYGRTETARLILSAGADVNARDNLGKTPVMLIMPADKADELYKILISYKADLKRKDMYGDTVLHTTTMMRTSPELTEFLIKNGADVNARNKEGVTPVEIAVQQGDAETVRILTRNGADINTKDTHGNSPLLLALAGDYVIFEATVNSSNITAQDSEGNTPLHTALLTDAPLSKIQYIISLTDDVNMRNRDGNSALFITVLKNRQKVGEMLLEKSADIFSTNINNNSPLRLALKYGGTIQDWLITSKTINATDGSGNTPLHYAAEWQYTDALNSLLTKGADINAVNANGETPLFSAAKSDNPEIVRIIAGNGADINARDNLGSTPLHAAIRWDARKSAEELINCGANIDARNSAGKSALAEAVISSNMAGAEFLLMQGANPNSSDKDGYTVLMDAISGGSPEIIRLLLSYGANPQTQEINGRNSYHEAALSGDRKIISLIREAGGNPMSRDKQGNTPFSLVLKKDFQTIREVLGDNLTVTDSDGNTPIHIAVRAGCPETLLEMLVDRGYPCDTRNSDGYTPLCYAVMNRDSVSARLLLDNKADPFQFIDKRGGNSVTIALANGDMQMISEIVKFAGSSADIQGNTILHYAAKSAPEETIKTLLAYGTDRTIKNIYGDTPYDVAVRWKRPDAANLLK